MVYSCIRLALLSQCVLQAAAVLFHGCCFPHSYTLNLKDTFTKWFSKKQWKEKFTEVMCDLVWHREVRFLWLPTNTCTQKHTISSNKYQANIFNSTITSWCIIHCCIRSVHCRKNRFNGEKAVWTIKKGQNYTSVLFCNPNCYTVLKEGIQMSSLSRTCLNF